MSKKNDLDFLKYTNVNPLYLEEKPKKHYKKRDDFVAGKTIKLLKILSKKG